METKIGENWSCRRNFGLFNGSIDCGTFAAESEVLFENVRKPWCISFLNPKHRSLASDDCDELIVKSDKHV
jgi:hypothetical protein